MIQFQMIQNKLTTLEGVVIVSATCFNSSISTEAHGEPLTEYFLQYFRVLRVFFQNILHIFTKKPKLIFMQVLSVLF